MATAWPLLAIRSQDERGVPRGGPTWWLTGSMGTTRIRTPYTCQWTEQASDGTPAYRSPSQGPSTALGDRAGKAVGSGGRQRHQPSVAAPGLGSPLALRSCGVREPRRAPHDAAMPPCGRSGVSKERKKVVRMRSRGVAKNVCVVRMRSRSVAKKLV